MSDLFEKQLKDYAGTSTSVDVEESVDEGKQGRWEMVYDGTDRKHDWIPKEIEQPNISVYTSSYNYKDEKRYSNCTIRVIANVKMRKHGKVKKVRICIPLTTLEMKDIIAKSEKE